MSWAYESLHRNSLELKDVAILLIVSEQEQLNPRPSHHHLFDIYKCSARLHPGLRAVDHTASAICRYLAGFYRAAWNADAV